MKNKNLLPLLAVAGGLYLANQTGKKASTTESKALAFTGDTFADEEALKDALVKILKANNIELRSLLRGADGMKGEKGDTGATGLAGDLIQNYGSSLVKNGALELGNLNGWNGGFLSDDFVGGLKYIISKGSDVISDFFRVRNNRLFSIEIIAKGDGNNQFYVNLFRGDKSTGLNTMSSTYNYCSVSNFGVLSNNSFNYKKCYFGGNLPNISSCFAENTVFAKFGFYKGTNSTVDLCIANLVVKEVDLGEAVPHNLPYLPLNQTVLNATTGKVGIFNGTTVDYYM